MGVRNTDMVRGGRLGRRKSTDSQGEGPGFGTASPAEEPLTGLPSGFYLDNYIAHLDCEPLSAMYEGFCKNYNSLDEEIGRFQSILGELEERYSREL